MNIGLKHLQTLLNVLRQLHTKMSMIIAIWTALSIVVSLNMLILLRLLLCSLITFLSHKLYFYQIQMTLLLHQLHQFSNINTFLNT